MNTNQVYTTEYKRVIYFIHTYVYPLIVSQTRFGAALAVAKWLDDVDTPALRSNPRCVLRAVCIPSCGCRMRLMDRSNSTTLSIIAGASVCIVPVFVRVCVCVAENSRGENSPRQPNSVEVQTGH